MATTTTSTLQPTESDNSVYFDAPILNIRTSQADDLSGGSADPAAVLRAPVAVHPISSFTEGPNVLRQPSYALTCPGRDTDTPAKAKARSDALELPFAAMAGEEAASPGGTTYYGPAEGTVGDGVLSRDYSKIGAARADDALALASYARSAHNTSRSASTIATTGSQAEPFAADSPIAQEPVSYWNEEDAEDARRTEARSHALNGAQDRRGRSGRRSSVPARVRRPAGSSPESPRSAESADGVGSWGMRVASPRSSVGGTMVSATSAGGGTFGGGAGTIGPSADPEPEERDQFSRRATKASADLGDKQTLTIGKQELKEGKRLSKVLKHEGKVERQALEVAIKELAELQALQHRAVKEESHAHAAHTKAMKMAHKEELAFLDAQRRHELAQTELHTKLSALDASREYAQSTTEMLQEKNREVELLRSQKSADDREREVKMSVLLGNTKA